jgi:glycosyltransferase involved in cell wall biosynthesis
MARAPRVAIVAASLDILGGQGVQANSLVDALNGDGYRAGLLAINPRFPAGLRRLRQLPYLRTVVNQAIYVPGLARLAAADIAHVFSASYASFLLAPVPAMAAARSLGKRVVLHYHSGEADDHLTNWGVLVHPWLRLAHRIVVPSVYLRDVFRRHGYDALVIPNVVDLSKFTYRDRALLQPRLLCTRNFEPYYRVDVILDAFAQLIEVHPSAMLTLAGYGSEEARLREMAARLTPRSVQFVGTVSPADMPALYASHDISVNASVVDNQPVSILEAFAAGLPVVSTPAGDIESMVEHGVTGFIVPPVNAPAIAQAVCALLADPAMASGMARVARARMDRFTWPAVRDAWAAVYAGTDRPASGTYQPWQLPHTH